MIDNENMITQHFTEKLYFDLIMICEWSRAKFLLKGNPHNKSQSIIQIDN